MDGLNALIATAGGYKPPDFDLTTARKNALSLQSDEMKLEDERGLRPMKNEVAAMAYLRDMIPTITADNYPEESQRLISRGVPAYVFPDFNQFVDVAAKENVHPEVKVREWANRVGMTVEQKIKLYEQQNKGYVPQDKAAAIRLAEAKQKPEARSNIAKMIEERDSLPAGDPNSGSLETGFRRIHRHGGRLLRVAGSNGIHSGPIKPENFAPYFEKGY